MMTIGYGTVLIVSLFKRHFKCIGCCSRHRLSNKRVKNLQKKYSAFLLIRIKVFNTALFLFKSRCDIAEIRNRYSTDTAQYQGTVQYTTVQYTLHSSDSTLYIVKYIPSLHPLQFRLVAILLFHLQPCTVQDIAHGNIIGKGGGRRNDKDSVVDPRMN